MMTEKSDPLVPVGIPNEFSDAISRLLPCPFCGGMEFMIVENGKVWTGNRWGKPVSVSVRHWCSPKTPGPSRMLERVGRDLEAAVAAWNMRSS